MKNVFYITSTVITRHLLNEKCHTLKRDALKDAHHRRDPVGRCSEWIIIRCVDLDKWDASKNKREIVAASSNAAVDFATSSQKSLVDCVTH